jgi:outer membrane protein insertion porin family
LKRQSESTAKNKKTGRHCTTTGGTTREGNSRMKLQGQTFRRLGDRCARAARLVSVVFLALAGALVAAPVGLGLVSVVTATQAQAQANIVVVGNRRVDADTIRSYFRVGPGEVLDQARIDEAVKQMFATGFFEDVRVARSGGRLVVTVVENLVINRVAFEGNRRINDDQLRGEVQSKPRGPFSRAIVQADVQRILEVYRRAGRFDIRVEPKTIDQPNGRVDLVFEITEGEKSGVKSIRFIGNTAFSDYRLRDVINTGTTNWLSWIRANDIYDPDKVEADKELIRRFYLKNGYADIRVVAATAQYDQASQGFVLTFTVDEGPRYRFGTVEVQSNVRDIDGATLRNRLRASAGGVYNAEQVEKSVENISVEMARRGYAFAQVRPRGDRDPSGLTINLLFVVEEGARAYIERINIRGNTRTRDYVIRREFDIAEGDAYNRVLIDRAERRLRNLGYFKTVRITNEQGSTPDRVIVNVDVEDQPTGEFSVAGGYSTAEGFIGEVAVAERNLLGRGQYVRIAAQWGEQTQGWDFSFTEPYFLGYRVSAGIDIFSKLTEESYIQSYDTRTSGATLRLGLPLNEELSLGLRYSLYLSQISLPELDDTNDSIPYDGIQQPNYGLYDCAGKGITNPLGPAACRKNGELSAVFKQLLNPKNGFSNEALVSQVGYTLAYNTLDNTINPRNGILIEWKQDLAGVGGDVNFLRSTIDARYYYEVYSDVVAIARGQAGHVTGWGSKDWRILDGFFMGPNLVRGFESAGIGPRDVTNKNGLYQDAVGATMYWGVSGELQFPIPFLPREFGMRGAAFADAGSAWGFEAPEKGLPPGTKIADEHIIRSSVGVGVIWQSPFGPIRFDYAWALSGASYDKEQAFRFSGGTRF